MQNRTEKWYKPSELENCNLKSCINLLSHMCSLDWIEMHWIHLNRHGMCWTNRNRTANCLEQILHVLENCNLTSCTNLLSHTCPLDWIEMHWIHLNRLDMCWTNRNRTANWLEQILPVLGNCNQKIFGNVLKCIPCTWMHLVDLEITWFNQNGTTGSLEKALCHLENCHLTNWYKLYQV